VLFSLRCGIFFEQLRVFAFSFKNIRDRCLSYSEFNSKLFLCRFSFFFKVCGESADVDDNVVDDFRSKIGKIVEGYKAEDIFSADETGLFFKVKMYVVINAFFFIAKYTEIVNVYVFKTSRLFGYSYN
jgi:hypothetical protein